MILLYSGFGEDVISNFSTFTNGLNENNTIALLLQGGNGFEKYLASYFSPIEQNCKAKIEVIAPRNESLNISTKDIEVIRNASAVFIGGGETDIYREIYCTKTIQELLHQKQNEGKAIAGLSAGSIILNNEIYNRETRKMSSGLGLVENIFVFPHLEEESYAYEMIKFVENNTNKTAYGLENDSFLKIEGNGKIIKMGKGKAYICSRKENEIYIRNMP
jgi:cyanophycinase